jgi:hypothetical protein
MASSSMVDAITSRAFKLQPFEYGLEERSYERPSQVTNDAPLSKSRHSKGVVSTM